MTKREYTAIINMCFKDPGEYCGDRTYRLKCDAGCMYIIDGEDDIKRICVDVISNITTFNGITSYDTDRYTICFDGYLYNYFIECLRKKTGREDMILYYNIISEGNKIIPIFDEHEKIFRRFLLNFLEFIGNHTNWKKFRNGQILKNITCQKSLKIFLKEGLKP